MKIALGLDCKDSPELVQQYVEAGADEFLAGYVSPGWLDAYGWDISPNRRKGPDLQFADPEYLREVIDTIHENNARIAITVNAHQFCAEQVSLLDELIEDLERVGADAYIIADPAVLFLFQEWGITTPLQLSVGAGCFNSDNIRFFMEMGNVERVVFPRKMAIGEMRMLTQRMADANVAFEAMVIGPRCLFNDEYCFTWHSNATSLFCAQFVDAETSTMPHYPRNWKNFLRSALTAPDDQFCEQSALDAFIKKYVSRERRGQRELIPSWSVEGTTAGMSAALAKKRHQSCGLCAIPALRAAGVDVLKLPTRGVKTGKYRLLQLVREMRDGSPVSVDPGRDLLNSPAYCNFPGSCYYNHQEVRT